jgi:hypothetical protein
MNDVQQLGEMLRHYAESEAHKKQLFETQSQEWASAFELFGQIQQWLEPAGTEPAGGEPRSLCRIRAEHPVETPDLQDRKTEHRDRRQMVEFVPDVMGSAGQISLAVMGLTAARYGSISLVGLPSGEWQWRKTNGLKDPDTFVFDADFLAQQLQSLIPRDRA